MHGLEMSALAASTPQNGKYSAILSIARLTTAPVMARTPSPGTKAQLAQPQLAANAFKSATQEDMEGPALAVLAIVLRSISSMCKNHASFPHLIMVGSDLRPRCPSESAFNFCKTDVPAPERCGSSSTNSFDIDQSAYLALTGTSWTTSSPNLMISVESSSC